MKKTIIIISLLIITILLIGCTETTNFTEQKNSDENQTDQKNENKQFEDCEKLSETEMNRCIRNLAIETQNISLCSKLKTSHSGKTNCEYLVVTKNNNPNLCEEEIVSRYYCYRNYAEYSKNETYCEKITDEILKNLCLESVQSIKKSDSIEPAEYNKNEFDSTKNFENSRFSNLITIEDIEKICEIEPAGVEYVKGYPNYYSVNIPGPLDYTLKYNNLSEFITINFIINKSNKQSRIEITISNYNNLNSANKTLKEETISSIKLEKYNHDIWYYENSYDNPYIDEIGYPFGEIFTTHNTYLINFDFKDLDSKDCSKDNLDKIIQQIIENIN
jgi:hypothetical protein